MMDELIKKQPEPRQSRIQSLRNYLQNPGYFSILLLGERGTGKTHWINYFTEKLPLKGNIVTINCPLHEPLEEFWDSTFKVANNGYLIIDEVEKLDKKSQEIILQIMSTGNGRYGFIEKEHLVRVVFTSSYDITALRDTEEYLTHAFFDRIAQLTTELPSFKEIDKGIRDDFKATWEKMAFGKATGEKYRKPGESLLHWLKINSNILHGNFRDLDKIAINWNQIQLNDNTLDDRTILEKIKQDFTKYYHFPGHKTELHDTFHFVKGKTKKEMEDEWRRTFKRWAKREYGTLKKATKALGMGERGFEKW